MVTYSMECARQDNQECPFCGVTSSEPCPLEEPAPFQGPAVGATTARGECSGGEVCESCQ